MKYLEKIKSPADIKRLKLGQLKEVAQELREVIIKTVSENGGHLASNLGSVELTLALHYIFNSPKDKILWDVGHQSYTHKLLTGRAGKFSTLRQDGGISGFPRIDENAHDAFGTGHASTSISAGLGIAEARDQKGEKFKVVVVIGDGALTGGLAFEGLNNAGHLKRDLIIILNHNEMSISPNVGALSTYMNRILAGKLYRKFKKEAKTILDITPGVGRPVTRFFHKAEKLVKGLFLPGTLFEELGFDYIGPIDGHSLEALIRTLGNLKNSSSPILVHIITKKGRGYSFAEKDPSLFHGIGPFDMQSGRPSGKGRMSYSAAFGKIVTELAQTDKRLVAITAAMKEGTGLEGFAEKFPERFYDVGIAEGHAVTFAAGLAASGMRPVVAIYSTFLQRAYDQLIHDVCLQKLPVIFAIDRAGVVGEDGPTHQGLFDISFLRHIPGLVVMAPKDALELKLMLEFALKLPGPSAIRYPRGEVPAIEFINQDIALGKSEILRTGTDIALIAVGNCLIPALKASERLRKSGINAQIVNARFIKPLDKEMVLSLASRIPRIMTIEENALQGGFGSSVLECLSDAGLSGARVKRLGIQDRFMEHGNPSVLKARYGIDDDGIFSAALAFVDGHASLFSTEVEKNAADSHS